MPTGQRLGRFRGLTINVIVGVGFLLTIAVWAAAGFWFAERIAAVERNATAIGQRYMRAQELISTTRASVYRASIAVRDALLDPSPAVDAYRRDMDTSYDAADAALAAYMPVLDEAGERQRIGQLRHDIRGLHDTMQRILASDSDTWRTRAASRLRTEIMPQRDEAIHVAEELQSLNRSAFVGQQAETTALYHAAQRTFWEVMALAMMAALVIGGCAAAYATRLERQLRLEQAKDARTAVDLQRLSARLVSAQEEERRVVARELHDEVGQVLTAVKMALTQVQRDGHVARPELVEEAREITDRAVQAVRDLTQLLHPPLLDDMGLPAAVDWYVQSIGKRGDLRIDLKTEGVTARLAADVEVTAYRLIQEALTNVRRHAGATACHVALRRAIGTLVVEVDDNGIGFADDPDATGPTGLGLIGMRERVARLGGSLTIQSGPGRGTMIRAELPVQPALALEDLGPPDHVLRTDGAHA
jgi:signal transduction histidine kinase